MTYPNALPISTAPKDGTHILAWIPHFEGEEPGHWYVVEWYNDDWTEAGGEGYATYEPTHWTLLPPPPEASPQ